MNNGNLFERNTAEKALELASWLRVEIRELQYELRLKQASLARCEIMKQLGKMLDELKQQELFNDEPPVSIKRKHK